MNKQFDARLERLGQSEAAKRIKRGRIGIEKESLRVGRDGYLATTPHPAALGSALTNAYITTDYSEALLEFITPPFPSVRETLHFLENIHQFVYRNIGRELLWATSMPCMVGDENSIPIARYGSSNVGRMKHVYRQGLSHRYGRVMQTISGVHFNYSLPERFWSYYQDSEGSDLSRRDFISNAYFALIRNFQRFGWVIPYLFGSSPAVCKSFIKGRGENFSEFDSGTLYRPYATSLRMSDIGYKNKNQSDLHISYDDIGSYVASLTRAIETPHPDYEAIGVKVGKEYRQLNANVLQIENEFYSFIRPKQIARSGEKPTVALKRRGVRYVEVRALDVSPFDPAGVNEDQLRFIEAFLIFCLLLESPAISKSEQADIDHNQQLVACCGRDPGIELRINHQTLKLREWINSVCGSVEEICELLDADEKRPAYRNAVSRQREAGQDPDRLPSARVLEEMRRHNESFFEFAMRVSNAHRAHFESRAMSREKLAIFEQEAKRSLRLQKEIEAADNISFDEYLRRYFAQTAVERERILG
ncbi:MAG TPA: glutamate--cysteine ligase [Gammaproteobacteria bacterium]|nr:glutamate--cysteine ligase [Gammaproteobacteria bacterium]